VRTDRCYREASAPIRGILDGETNNDAGAQRVDVDAVVLSRRHEAFHRGRLGASGEAARATFLDKVVSPGLAAPKGRRRLVALCDAFLSHVERRVFPGGCFFSTAAAEVGTRRGRVRDAVARQQAEWLTLLEDLGREAQDLGELDRGLDPAQVAFELNALIVAANNSFILQGDPAILERARAGVRTRVG
jgi:Tetracyclin repressor-like, C-terminal domain